MITLHSYEVSADIKDRYAICRYYFEFENTQDNGSNELRFEITIDPNAFISKFSANINGELFISETKEKQTASKEYSTAKNRDENAILISQPYKNIANVFEIKTNVDANSKISLMIQIEEYLQKTFGFNALSIQILRNFSKYNIEQSFNSIRFKLNVEDISGIYDVRVPLNNNDIVIEKQQMDKLNKKCQITGIITNESISSVACFDVNTLKVNDRIDVKDAGRWYTSQVLEVNKDANTIKIHYLGFSNKYDEDINIYSERLAQENINSTAKINELTLKYKIKGEQSDSHLLFDYKSHTFCHIISDIISDSTISDTTNTDTNNEGQNDHNMNNISIPRRVIFVVDKSTSMGGKKWLKTISATTKALKQLRNGYDRFGVILFSTNIDILLHDSACLQVDDQNMSQIINMIENETVDGRTNINDALLTAIELLKKDIILLNNDKECKHNFFMNQILFLTDGQPNGGETDTKQIISNVQNANDLSAIDKYNKKISLFTFGVGNDANDSQWIQDLNHAFLKLLAIHNHGFYQRIKESYADTKLTECFNILSKPILSNINVEYQNKNISDLTNTKFNTLYCGNDLIICGKVDKKHTMDYLTMNLTISAVTATMMKYNNLLITKQINISKRMKLNIDSSMNDNNTNNTERIWAYLKLQQYALRQLMHDNDIIEIDDDEKEERHSLPLALALQYKFVTPWTSMIVVKKKAVNINNPQIPNITAVDRSIQNMYKSAQTQQLQLQQQLQPQREQVPNTTASRGTLKSKVVANKRIQNMYKLLSTHTQQLQLQQQQQSQQHVHDSLKALQFSGLFCARANKKSYSKLRANIQMIPEPEPDLHFQLNDTLYRPQPVSLQRGWATNASIGYNPNAMPPEYSSSDDDLNALMSGNALNIAATNDDNLNIKKKVAAAPKEVKPSADNDDDDGLSDWLLSIGFKKKKLALMLHALHELGLYTMGDLEEFLMDLYTDSFGNQQKQWMDKIKSDVLGQGIKYAQWIRFSTKAKEMIEDKVEPITSMVSHDDDDKIHFNEINRKQWSKEALDWEKKLESVANAIDKTDTNTRSKIWDKFDRNKVERLDCEKSLSRLVYSLIALYMKTKNREAKPPKYHLLQPLLLSICDDIRQIINNANKNPSNHYITKHEFQTHIAVYIKKIAIRRNVHNNQL